MGCCQRHQWLQRCLTFFLFLFLFTLMLAVEISILFKQIKKGPEYSEK